METLKFKYNKGVRTIYPVHPFTSNWLFEDDQEAEANLARTVAEVAEKNGMSINEVHHAFPLILRILKSKIKWAE